MKKILKGEKQFKALGFVEVLIAIVVVSIVSAVFLSLAGDVMKELIQTERIEAMARIAKDGVSVAQEVANRDAADILEDKNFPQRIPQDIGRCYIPIREEGGDPVYKFAENPSGTLYSFPNDSSERPDIVATLRGPEGSKLRWYEDYFMVMCLLGIDTGTTWAHVRFWVGDINVEGQITNDRDMKDFIYYAVIEL